MKLDATTSTHPPTHTDPSPRFLMCCIAFRNSRKIGERGHWSNWSECRADCSNKTVTSKGTTTRSRKVKHHGKEMEEELQEVECQNPCPLGICPTVVKITKESFSSSECPKMSAKMVQMKNAAEWNLITSIQHRPQIGISALAIVRHGFKSPIR